MRKIIYIQLLIMGWLQCTQYKLPFFFQEPLMSPVQPVRKAALELLIVLYRAASPQQKNIFNRLLKKSLENITQLGLISRQVLQTVFAVLHLPQHYEQLKTVIQKLDEAIKFMLSHKDHGFFVFLEDHLFQRGKFSSSFLQLNGCTSCISEQFAALSWQDQVESSKATSNRIYYTFKRMIPIESLTFINRTKVVLKEVILKFWRDQECVSISKSGNQCTFQVKEILKSVLFQFRYDKPRQMNCSLCKLQIQGLVCPSNCSKGIQMQINFSKELKGRAKIMMLQIRNFYKKIQQNKGFLKQAYSVFKDRRGRLTPDIFPKAFQIQSLFTLMNQQIKLLPQDPLPLGSRCKTHPYGFSNCYSCAKIFIQNFLDIVELKTIKQLVSEASDLACLLGEMMSRLVVQEQLSQSLREKGLKLLQHLEQSGEMNIKDFREDNGKGISQSWRQIVNNRKAKVISQPQFRFFIPESLLVERLSGFRLRLSQCRHFPLLFHNHISQNQMFRFLKWAYSIPTLWNCWIFQAVQIITKFIASESHENLLKIVLKGISTHHLQALLLPLLLQAFSPKRKKILIRLQSPDKQLKDYERRNQQKLQHPYVQIKQIHSNEVGFTFKDLDIWICKQLGSEMTLDLLVQGKLVDDLSVTFESVMQARLRQHPVEKQIFMKERSINEFLRVVYRLRGVFGQATEQMYGHLQDQAMKVVIQKSKDFEKGQNLSILFQLLKNPSRLSIQNLQDLISFFDTIFKRQEVLKSVAKTDLYIDLLIKSSIRLLKEGRSFQMAVTNIARLIDNSTKQKISRKKSMILEQQDLFQQSLADLIPVLIESLKDFNVKSVTGSCILKLLPWISKDEERASSLLFQFLKANKNPDLLTQEESQALLYFFDNLPQNYSKFKESYFQCGAFSQALKLSLENDNALAYKLIQGGLKGCFQAQKCLLTRFREMTQKLKSKEQKAENKQVAQDIINYLSKGQLVQQDVRQICLEYQRKKQEQIKSLKQKLRNKSKTIIDKFLTDQLKQTLHCVICKHGYLSQPGKPLGIYLLSLKAQQEDDSYRGIVSRTCFCVVHLHCHSKTVQFYNSKNEWQLASSKNGGSQCNNWLPINYKLSKQDIQVSLKKYKELGWSISGGRIPIQIMLVNDLRHVLKTLAEGKGDSKMTHWHTIRMAVLFQHLIAEFQTSFKQDSWQPVKLLMLKQESIHSNKNSIIKFYNERSDLDRRLGLLCLSLGRSDEDLLKKLDNMQPISKQWKQWQSMQSSQLMSRIVERV